MVESIFKIEDIHKEYLEWMHEHDNGSYRKDRFLQLLDRIPHEKKYEIEQWLVAAFAAGIETGYNINEAVQSKK